MKNALIDTDIFSEIMKRKNQRVRNAAKAYIRDHHRLALSGISVYELHRGLLATGARQRQMLFFDLLNTSDVFGVTIQILLRAAELWAEGERNGYPHEDADLIIAATALVHSRVLVTGNADHFSWIPDLQIEDWQLMIERFLLRWTPSWAYAARA